GDSVTGKAFRWTAGSGVQRVQDVLSASGVNLAGWQLTNATGVSADGTIIVGYGIDPAGAVEAWIAQLPLATLQVTPLTNMVASGNPGGPFFPPSFDYSLPSEGPANFAFPGLPPWLSASMLSGPATASPTTVTFSFNANANGLASGNYSATINFI